MAELKTKQTVESVKDFFDGIADETVRADSEKISKLMEKATGEKPKCGARASSVSATAI